MSKVLFHVFPWACFHSDSCQDHSGWHPQVIAFWKYLTTVAFWGLFKPHITYVISSQLRLHIRATWRTFKKCWRPRHWPRFMKSEPVGTGPWASIFLTPSPVILMWSYNWETWIHRICPDTDLGFWQRKSGSIFNYKSNAYSFFKDHIISENDPKREFHSSIVS
jgi:hypothetical protein